MQPNLIQELLRLPLSTEGGGSWKRRGPSFSLRSWVIVRENYGIAGLAIIPDDKQRLHLATELVKSKK